MSAKIQGWSVGLLCAAVACLGMAALGANDPASTSPKKKVPSLLAPPADAPGRGGTVKRAPAVRLDQPRAIPDEFLADRVAPADDRVENIEQISYDSPAGAATHTGTPATGPGSPDWRPVAQFARKAGTPVATPQPPIEMQRGGVQPPGRPAQPPDTAEVLSNIGPVEVQGLDQLGVIILRGNPQDVENMRQIIEKIQEIAATVEPYIRVFQLKRATASQVRTILLDTYAGSTGTTTTRTQPSTTTGGGQAGGQSTAVLQTPALKRFTVAADDRTNTLIVGASPQMMEELSRLIERIDADGAPTVNEVRVFQLKNAESIEVTNILTQAIAGESATAAGAALGAGAQGAGSAVSGGGEPKIGTRSAVLEFKSPDGEQRWIQSSGILDYVRVTAQVRTNSVIVSAPSSSMPLLAAVIAELDRPPSIVADMKVIPLKNSDATNMRTTLSELFDIEVVTTAGGIGGVGAGGQSQFQRPVAVAEGAAPPISIRVAIDARTNSLIISGPPNALEQVEAVIRVIDGNSMQSRENKVIRLKNASAAAVATAITNFFNQKRTIENQARTLQQQDLIGAYQRLEQEVVAVAETVTNSVLISSSPRYFDQAMKIIEELDREQQQVMIQVVIARLDMRDDFEFGLEWGLQRKVLFERGDLAANPLNPGFNFNSTSPLPNTNVVSPSAIGPQALSNFSLGRSGIDSVGGLVLSASSNTVSALLRALEIEGFVEVINRPQIMTLDGRAARLQVGQRVPYSSAPPVTTTGATSTGTTLFLDVGIILDVTPTITPDGRVVLQVAPEISEVINFDTIGAIINAGTTIPITAPRVAITLADTVVSVNDGQTIVLGGLIQPREEETVRKIPWFGDLPYIGSMFRYTQNMKNRTELLIVMTPHIIKTKDQAAADLERIKDTEVARMDWVMCDVPPIHGDLGLSVEGEPVPQVMAPETMPIEQGRLNPTPDHSIKPMSHEAPAPLSGPPPDWSINPAGPVKDGAASLAKTRRKLGLFDKGAWWTNRTGNRSSEPQNK